MQRTLGKAEITTRKILNICFPRSGHHFLTNCLLKYFSGDIHFPETDGLHSTAACSQVIRAGELRYCEYYRHCGQVPCKDPDTNLQKHHDQKLNLPYSEEQRYLIQFREPVAAHISYFRYHLASDPEAIDSEEEWVNYLYTKTFPFKRPESQGACPGHSKSPLVKSYLKGQYELTQLIPYWRSFVQKWVMGTSPANCLYVDYDQLVDNTEAQLARVINFITPHDKIDDDLVAEIATTARKRKDPFGFDYANPELFSAIREAAANELLFIRHLAKRGRL